MINRRMIKWGTMGEIFLKTNHEFELVDVTAQVEAVVEKSGVEEGICLVFVPHATAALWVNENELGLKQDALAVIQEWFPKRGYKHDLVDNNAWAHLASSFLGQSKVFPVENGRLIRGTWQNIFLVELDGPRTQRRVVVTVVGKR